MRKHIVITGTGRCGTSFLVQLLTRLGLDTGFVANELEEALDPVGRAGLEGNIKSPNAPYVVKSPNISNYIHEILEDDQIQLDMVIVPIRDIDDATESRVKVSKANLERKGMIRRVLGSKRGFAGGMINTSNPEKQVAILLRSLSHLLVTCAKHDQPLMLIHYPRLLEDPLYLFEKLRPLIGTIEVDDFVAKHAETRKPDWG